MTHEAATRLFYSIVWPHRAMVLRTARFFAGNHAEADDLAQETLVKAFKSISQFDATAAADRTEEASARAWLSAILRNTWIDRVRGRHATVSLDQHEMDTADHHGTAMVADAGDPADLLEQFSDAEVITALRGLPEEIRWTLMLVDVEQLDQADAAKIMGIPEGTVKSRAHRGRRMLRDQLANRAPASAMKTSSEEL